jgi:hypothetical protein
MTKRVMSNRNITEHYYILEFNVVYSGRSPPTLRRNVLPPSSGSKLKASKKSARLASCFLLSFPLSPEDGGRLLPDYTAFFSHHNQQDVVAVTLQPCIRVVLSSNLGLDAGPTILTEVLRGFLRSFQANAGIVPRLRHNSFLPNSFQFIIRQSPYHSTSYSLDSDKGRQLISPSKNNKYN